MVESPAHHGVTCRLAGAVVVALAFLMPSGAGAAPGDADPSFSQDGFAFTEFGPSAPTPGGGAAQPDGKIVVAGVTSVNYGSERFPLLAFSEHVTRFNADGTIDRSFGAKGTVDLPGTSGSLPNAEVAIQSSGRILVTGLQLGSPQGFSVFGLTPDGQLDPTFGDGDGIFDQPFSDGYVLTRDIAVGTSDQIALAGLWASGPPSRNSLAAARLLPDGELDPGFSGDGWNAVRSEEFNYEGPWGVARRDDGRILAVDGINDVSPSTRPILAAQFRADGELDPSFSADGLSVIDPPGSLNTADATLDSQGRLLILSDPFQGFAPSIIRLQASGALDSSFGVGGTSVLDPPDPHAPGQVELTQIAVDADDRPIVTGADHGVVLGRLTQAGTLDQSFATEGWSTVYSRGLSIDGQRYAGAAGDLWVSGDRAILAARAFAAGGLSEPAIARFTLGQGPPDRDADGVADDADPCPQIYGSCPRLRRTLSAKFRPRRRELVGRATRDGGCERRRRVVVLERVRGRDRTVGRAPGGTDLNYRVSLPSRGGTFYARTARVLFPYGVCPARRSKAVRVPAAKADGR